MLEQLQAEVARLRGQLDALMGAPRWHRKDLERHLGIGRTTLTKRMKDRNFPQPIYDGGRPKWMPSQFNGQTGQTA